MPADKTVSDTGTATDGQTASKTSRRRFVAGAAGVAATVGITGCLGSSKSSGNTETVTWLITPTENPKEIKAQYRPMVDYVKNEVDGVEMKMNVATDYSAILPALKSGQADIAFDDVTLISSPDVVDVMGTMVTEGTAYYISALVANKDSSYQNLTDLTGEKISFCDPISTSGSIYPLYALKQAGLDIGEAPTGEPTDFSGEWTSHDTSLQQLFNRPEIRANGNSDKFVMPYMTSDQLSEEAKKHSAYADETGSKANKLKPLWWSDKIPKQPVITRSNWDSEKRGQIREALAGASVEKLQQYKTDQPIQFSAMQKTSDDTYQPVIDRVDALGIELR